MGYICYSSLHFKSVFGLFWRYCIYPFLHIQEYLKYAEVMNRDIQIKMTYHFTPTRVDIIQETKNQEGYGELDLHILQVRLQMYK